jgi:hypothetical protein
MARRTRLCKAQNRLVSRLFTAAGNWFSAKPLVTARFPIQRYRREHGSRRLFLLFVVHVQRVCHCAATL